MTGTQKNSLPNKFWPFIVALIFSSVAGYAGFQGGYALLLNRELRLAEQDVKDFREKHIADIEKLRTDPLVHELEIGPVPDDKTRVLIQFDVEDLETFRKLETTFSDVDLERFRPIWDTKIRNYGNLTREPKVAIRGEGASRGIATRSTLAGGIGGITSVIAFSAIALLFLRKRS
ncbi:hypothetical protein [Planctomicrobium sp. SH527]|uniref:hypothetical protein n=1 Tax=Planctomicrobium sp. SH527 TaxID=3448123 RepID=UPI003F5B3BA2